MRTIIIVTGLLLLLTVEILHIYFIMPFPGSQHNNSIGFAYWLDNNIWWVRTITLLTLIYPVILFFRNTRIWKKVLLATGLLLYAVVFYFFNFRFKADKMFYQSVHSRFATAQTNEISNNKLVIGLVVNGEAKAYPVQLIGYHHQVRDTVGNMPVMVTYCTVCRTGRVFSPVVNGKNETFRLVGMDHFNAMFEDQSTKSWWQQATGIAVAGPLKGASLQELPSTQATLAAWLRQYPGSMVLQPDTVFSKQYADLADFDNGTIKSGLEKRDSGSWQFKSWVIGVTHNKVSKAYDWNHLVSAGLIQDSLPGLPMVLVLEKDSASFHVWNRQVKGNDLQFIQDTTRVAFHDLNTGSTWNMSGQCISGALAGVQLQPVPAYQEFWHSWRTFHPKTLR
ncbi:MULTISPECIES: DUF3179 domain-containing (seleno)protein [Niastella]|uniref:DUF3179 domain-containing protein n=1 Tax=Niastella soli TaxID=2821487 RepID=A0ABS3Z146_9BACT|nr:DUF3179 domain-containing (seleno)protein [Niastella soli]MBO9203880.1 DUF3179 domain-containing protein [Niastella soli]